MRSGTINNNKITYTLYIISTILEAAKTTYLKTNIKCSTREKRAKELHMFQQESKSWNFYS